MIADTLSDAVLENQTVPKALPRSPFQEIEIVAERIDAQEGGR